jgi:hypothetical protein
MEGLGAQCYHTAKDSSANSRLAILTPNTFKIIHESNCLLRNLHEHLEVTAIRDTTHGGLKSYLHRGEKPKREAIRHPPTLLEPSPNNRGISKDS